MKKIKYGNFLCLFCEGATETKIISLTIKRRRKQIIFQKVEAEVCQKCGESYYDSRSLLKEDKRLLEELEQQKLKALKKYRDLLKQQAEEKRLKALESKIPKKRGRKPLDEKIIEKAKAMARDKFLPDVALSLGISLGTLYNYGITRESLNKEKEAKSKEIVENDGE